MDQSFITRIVEASLLAASQPLTLAQLHALFPDDQPAPPGSVEQALAALREASDERGVELVEVASGFRFQVKADVHPWVARLWTDRKTRYTRATLETLALIAYRQPITRGEIEQVRGVAVSSNIIQSLEEREWIRVVGHRDVPGKPALFGTTKGFLDYFGLKRLDELPPLSELKDIGELEPQLQFDRAPIAAAVASGDAASNTDADAAADNDVDSDSGNHQDLRPDTDASAEAAHDTMQHGLGIADDLSATDADPHEVVIPDDDMQYAPDTALMGNPDAAPGERAADVNDPEQDNAVETTTVPETEAASYDDEPELQKND